jgi:tRNA dimethylallyltransferase
VVTGPTASGKTSLAAQLASRLNGEIISADSRQVYRGMDLATGKDREDYLVEGNAIRCHLIDIADAGYEYSVFEFVRDFKAAWLDIKSRGKTPLLCGGSGMYIESVLKGYDLVRVPSNPIIREQLGTKPVEKLIAILKSYKSLHNITDTTDRNRLLRAIEIQEFCRANPSAGSSLPNFSPVIIGILFERETLRKRITDRLKRRLEHGMEHEIKELLQRGLTPGQLKFYGLEYRYLTQYITREITYDEMFRLLNIAISQFAKRQMTWFRKMEREGFKIHWIDGNLNPEQLVEKSLQIIYGKNYQAD